MRLPGRAIAILATLVAGVVLLRVFDPAAVALFPPCAFHLLTGLLCPGCGLTRAVHQVMHGEIASALALNALLPLYVLLLGGLVAGWLWREVRGSTPDALRVRASVIALSGVAMLAFGVLRNVA